MGYESTREGEKEVRVLVCVRACVRVREEVSFGGEEWRKKKKRGNRLKQRMSQ